MGIFLAGGVNAGKPSRLLTKYSLLPTHTVHPIHYSLQLTAYSLLHAVYLLLTQCTGKTSLSKLIQSSAGEYAGSGESASLNQKKGAVAAAQTRLSNASGGRQFALLDELPAREQFCWLKYKNFTTGFSTQRAVNPNATTLIKEETPMLLIACNLGQLPLKPDESQGVLEKVCILFSEHLGNFGASEAGAEIAHNIQEGRYAGPMLRILWQTLRAFVDRTGRAFDYAKDMPDVLKEARTTRWAELTAEATNRPLLLNFEAGGDDGCQEELRLLLE